MNLLTILLLIPGITLLLLLLLPAKKNAAIRNMAIAGAALQFLYTCFLAYNFIQAKGELSGDTLLFTQSFAWFEPLDIHFSYGLDGISLIMILLTSMVVFAGILVSGNIQQQSKEFYILMTLLGFGAYGFFIATDLFMLFFFLEIAVVPKYLLIGMYGSGARERNAMKLALMLMGGSALVFIGIVALYFFSGKISGNYTWNIQELALVHIPLQYQQWLYMLTFIGFGVFTALFPFHSWAPDGHSSAPTAASMFLAGVSMKLGGYGCLRVSTFLFPEAADQLSWIFIILASIAILYGAMVTLTQKDLKYMNAFSSVSHCGFVVLGIAMLTRTAIMGAVMQMVSHGIMTALFFGIIGMVYQRTHTRQINELGGILHQTPFIGSMFLIVGLCSLGLPGMSGFVSEMTVFVGSWERTGLFYRIATVIACASIVVTAVYILRAIGSVIWGSVRNEAVKKMVDATPSERVASILLATAIFLIGTCPFWVVRLIENDSLAIARRLLTQAFQY